MPSSERRAKIESVTLEHLPGDRCLVRVTVVRQLGAKLHQTFKGESRGEWSPLGELRGAAAAALQTIQRAYGASEDDITLQDLKLVESFDQPAVIVAVVVHREGDDIRLVGFCEAGDDPMRGAAKAVFTALNRYLGFAFPE